MAGWYGPRAVVRFLLRRLAGSLVSLVVFVALVFVLIDVSIPYDFATRAQFGGGDATPLREALGLLRPLHERLGEFLLGLVRFDLGTSFTGVPVTEIVLGSPLWTTTLIFVVGGGLAFLLGTWIGRVVAWQRRRWVGGIADSAAVLLATTFPPLLVFLLVRYTEPVLRAVRRGFGLPTDPRHVWDASRFTMGGVTMRIALSLLVALGVALVARTLLRRGGRPGWLAWPIGAVAVVAAVAWWRVAGFGPEAADVLFAAPRYELGLSAGQSGGGSPVLGIIAFLLLAYGEFQLIVESAMVSERTEDYVLTAQAKGVTRARIRDVHVSRNVALPALSRLAVALPALLTGLVIVERELELRGLSQVLFDAVDNVDTPVIIGVLVVIGLLVLVLRLGLEVLHAWLDPRVRDGVMGGRP